MVFPRITAAIFVLLLIVMISFVGMSGAMWIGSTLTHGNNVKHDSGKILSIDPNMDFVLETATLQRVSFQCSGRCRGALSHMQRHLVEKAHTDVYYIQDANHTLIAVDVD